ncbi:flagellar biosynthesis anti-sigma factor FlgM [Niveibacterium sp. SC-1]|uniref:flagellar biosynthesis anti-sigma factor FlgM n=1 Tax=Niveibacterium sp. SC-1 TaxID=3135646 RepID=UPI00311F2883
MKIEGFKSAGVGGDAKTRPAREGGAKTEAAGNGGTNVALSNMQQLEGTLAGVSEVDTVKVGEIKQAISEGRFRVDPEKVADGLIQSVRDMLQTQVRSA